MATATMFLGMRENRENSDKTPILVSASMPSKKDQPKHTRISQAQKIIESERLTMSQDDTMIGNQEGLDFLSQIKASIESLKQEMGEQHKALQELQEDNKTLQEDNKEIRDRHKALQEDNKEIRERNDELYRIVFRLNDEKMRLRAAELVGKSEKYEDYREAQEERNQAVHGADIEFDLEVLEWMETHDTERLEAAREGFEVMYGLSSTDGKSLILTVPETIQFLNKKADLTILHRYTRSKQKDKIKAMEEICKRVIDSCQGQDAPSLTKLGSQLAKLDGLERQWNEEENKKGKREKEKGLDDEHENRRKRRKH